MQRATANGYNMSAISHDRGRGGGIWLDKAGSCGCANKSTGHSVIDFRPWTSQMPGSRICYGSSPMNCS